MERMHTETHNAINIDALNAVINALEIAETNQEHPSIINSLITVKLTLERIIQEDRFCMAREAHA